MATVHFRNAEMLLGGARLSGSLNELTVEMSAEMLDETAFGDTTRINKGGLLAGTISAGGHCEFGTGNIHDTLFNGMDQTELVAVVFPDGITEGDTAARGYGMLGILEDLTIGGSVGSLLPVTFTMQGRGVNP